MAAAHVIPAQIEDDWQDLDSNLSVRSLPTSDDEYSDDEASVVVLGARAPPPTAADTPSASTLRPEVLTPEKPNAADAVANSAGDAHCTPAIATLELPFRPAILRLVASPPTPSQYPLSLSQDSGVLGRRDETKDDLDDQADARSETSQGTVRDPSENPVTHHRALDSLALIVNEIGGELEQTIAELPSFNIPVVCGIQDALHVLTDHFTDLEPILGAYSKYWTNHGQSLAADQIPLHTGLMDWMDSLDQCMSNLHKEVQRQVEQAHATSENDATAPAIGAAFLNHFDTISSLSESLTEFLPIMKLDFSEFQTKNMIFPEHDTESNDAERRLEGPRPEMVQIRRELYSLKDQLQATSTLVSPILIENRAYFKDKAGNDALKAMETMDTLAAVIATSLTNTGSDWIESAISTDGQDPRISYPAFASLSPDILRDVASHLVQFREEIDYGDEPDIEREFGKEVIREHQIFKLVDEGLLQTLLATLDFLQGLLMGESLD